MALSVAPRLTLSDTDRVTLSNWTRRRRTAQALVLRARIVLACSEPDAGSDGTLAERLGVSRPTVLKWRQRFTRLGLDAPRSGAPRIILDEQVERVLTTMLETLPANATLEHAQLGCTVGHEPDGHLAHLARLRPGAASHRDVQALH